MKLVNRRIFLWSLVVVYTLALPHVINIYTNIAKNYSQHLAARIPLVIIGLFGVFYIAAVFIHKTDIKALLFLIPGSAITIVIISLESNPNKYIHIPEYVLMTWLLFAVFSRDYFGKGMIGLIIICASLLGIIDEIMQGIHPVRAFGLRDMVVNSAASVIGALSIMGLQKKSAENWGWIQYQDLSYKFLLPALFGLVGTILMINFLLDVKNQMHFKGVYPLWLTGWHIIFLAVGLYCIALQGIRFSKTNRYPEVVTALLWTTAPLCILLAAHAMVVITVLLNLPFK